MATTMPVEEKKESKGRVCDLRSQDLVELTPCKLKLLCSQFDNNCGISIPFVTELLLDHNDLEDIPGSIGQMTSLKRLSVVGNTLITIPESIGMLSSLEILNLNENEIHSFPNAIRNLKSLKVLSAISNNINSIENGNFIELTNLKELFLDENMLTSLPNDFGCLESLEKFECSENEIVSLPNGFGNLKKLEVLSLDSNRLEELPSDFCKLPSLNILLLSNNSLSHLPNTMASSRKLKKLILSKNDLSTVPNWFEELESIEELAIQDNEILDKPLSNKFCQLATQIVSLQAGRNYISDLPENIGTLKKLKHLHLGSTMFELERSNFQSGNWLKSLPDSFAQLTNLEKLHLDENQIASLPSDFGKLKQLTWLDLGQNQLEHLPESFSQLESLTYLQLSKNRLKALPVDIGHLIHLVELRLDSNLIAVIPESFSNLKNLHSLDLFNNKLEEFPSPIISLKNLIRLDVEGNNFSTAGLPKLLKGNVYPERDASLRDNWRGKTREDKVKCEVIEIPATNDEEKENEDDEVVCFNENALIRAMRAGMSLWKHHGGSKIRETTPSSMKPQKDIDSLSYEITDEKGFEVAPTWLSAELEEDWDEEIRNECYQDSISTCITKKQMSSALIDEVNRYPPCVQAFSPFACYESLIYKKSTSTKKDLFITGGGEGQFEDADE